MSGVSRRDALKLFAAAPVAGALDWSAPSLDRAARMMERLQEEGAQASYKPKFFTAAEWRTVRVLADMIIPKDEHSGSASDAGVPEFMDYILVEYPDGQTAIRGGLAWLDAECERRFGKVFVECREGDRKKVLDDIAWPKKARPEMSQGVAFFNRFRDFTASAFFSSKMGTEDLKYIGNTPLPAWDGCPPEALQKLGVSYTA